MAACSSQQSQTKDRPKCHNDSPKQLIPSNSEIQDSKNITTYSKILKTSPTRDQAIVIEASDNIMLKDYVLAVGQLTDPSNIRFVSRISNGRICIYLTNKKIVEDITTKYTRIKINNESLMIRPLITKTKRVILSNVCPVIPNSVIEEKFSQYGIKPSSSIDYIRAGISIPGFSHVLSFRRQMYVQPDDADKLPESMQIAHEGINYWIYISGDTPMCFLCKQEGHFARQCRNKPNDIPSTLALADKEQIVLQSDLNPTELADSQNNSDLNTNMPTEDNTNILKQGIPTTEEVNTSNELAQNLTNDYLHDNTNKSCNQSEKNTQPNDLEEFPYLPKKTAIPSGKKKNPKRSLVSSESANQVNDDPEIISDNISDEATATQDYIETKSKPPKKRTKTLHNLSIIEESLLSVQTIVESSPNEFVLNFLQLKSFIENTIGTADVSSVAKSHTSDINGLVDTLHKLYPHFTNQSIKNKITRIINKLINDQNASTFNDNKSTVEDNDTNT